VSCPVRREGLDTHPPQLGPAAGERVGAWRRAVDDHGRLQRLKAVERASKKLPVIQGSATADENTHYPETLQHLSKWPDSRLLHFLVPPFKFLLCCVESFGDAMVRRWCRVRACID